MKRIILVLSMMLATSAAVAQNAANQGGGQPGGHTNEKPVDNGPTKPGANNAYQGGGVVLQGAPGAPAPNPAASPSGEAPSNAVPATK